MLHGTKLPTRFPIHRGTSSTQENYFLKQELQFSDYHWKQIKRLDTVVYLVHSQWTRIISHHMPKLTVSGRLNSRLLKFYENYYSIRPMWVKFFNKIEEWKISWENIKFLQEDIDSSINCHKNDEGDDENKGDDDSSDEDISNHGAKKVLVLKSAIEEYRKGLQKHDAGVAKFWKKLSKQSKATLDQWKHVEAEMQSEGLLEGIQEEVSYFKYCIFHLYNSATHYKCTGTDVNSIGRQVNDNENNDKNNDDAQNGCLEDTKLLQILSMLNADSHRLRTVEGTHEMFLHRSEWTNLLAKPAAQQFFVQNEYQTPGRKRPREDADEDEIRVHDCGFPRNPFAEDRPGDKI
jgi:hypothetical protein